MASRVYDLEAVQLPVLKGAGLRLFAGVLGNRVLRAPLMGKLLKDGGITVLRQMTPEEPPTFEPLIPGESPASADARRDALREAETLGAAPEVDRWVSIRRIAAAYREGSTTPEQVAERFLDNLSASEQGDKPLRTFIATDADDIRAQAKAASARLAAGEPKSLLDGVPMAIKDELDLVPYPTTVGTAFLGSSPARADSTVAARLREAGAVLVGKCNMHEIGINPTGQNIHHGTARNPWDRSRDTGGSSSGSAGAVAAGLVPLAIGADGGGSIRIPASHCGVVGLKATFGRIPETGAAPLCWSVAHVGPLGATVDDVALAYAAIAGPDPADPNSRSQPDPALGDWRRDDLKGLKLGVFRPWFEHAAPNIVQTCESLVQRLSAAGAEIVEIEIPGLDAMRIAHAVTILSEMSTSMSNFGADTRRFAPSTRVNLTIGSIFASSDYVKAQRLRTRAMATFDEAFSRVDAILTPGSAATAPPILEDALAGGWSDLTTTSEVMRFIIPGNWVGMPAICFPAGYDSAGLPIGMQAMAPHWREDLCFRIAWAAERLVERRMPGDYYSLLVD